MENFEVIQELIDKAQPANFDSNRKPSFDWEEFYRLAWKDKIARQKKNDR